MTARMLDTIEMSWDVSGKTAFVGSILFVGWNRVAEYLTLESINPYVTVIAGSIGVMYMISKWRGQRIKNKKDQIELDNIVGKDDNDE